MEPGRTCANEGTAPASAPQAEESDRMKIDAEICNTYRCPNRTESSCRLIALHNEIARASGDAHWPPELVPDNCIHLVEYMKK